MLVDGFPQTFPVNAPQGLTGPVKSYLYWQYQDDPACQAFVDAYNSLAGDMVAWFNYIQLPIYTGLSGALLDWVAGGLYGYTRPTLSQAQYRAIGAYGTYDYGRLGYGLQSITSTSQFENVNDDIFKRMITWHRYRGDGLQYSTPWLKRRVHRFLNGPNGVSPYIDNTYDVSVAYSNRTVTITIPNNATSQIFQYAMQNGVLAVPFGYTYNLVL